MCLSLSLLFIFCSYLRTIVLSILFLVSQSIQRVWVCSLLMLLYVILLSYCRGWLGYYKPSINNNNNNNNNNQLSLQITENFLYLHICSPSFRFFFWSYWHSSLKNLDLDRDKHWSHCGAAYFNPELVIKSNQIKYIFIIHNRIKQQWKLFFVPSGCINFYYKIFYYWVIHTHTLSPPPLHPKPTKHKSVVKSVTFRSICFIGFNVDFTGVLDLDGIKRIYIYCRVQSYVIMWRLYVIAVTINLKQILTRGTKEQYK